MSRWWSRVAFIRDWHLNRPGEPVYHRMDRSERSEVDGVISYTWIARCGLHLTHWSGGANRAPATTYMLLEHARNIGRACSICYPDGDR
jgi:hypothetical protein